MLRSATTGRNEWLNLKFLIWIQGLISETYLDSTHWQLTLWLPPPSWGTRSSASLFAKNKLRSHVVELSKMVLDYPETKVMVIRLLLNFLDDPETKVWLLGHC